MSAPTDELKEKIRQLESDEAFLESKMDVKGRFRLSQILFPLISMYADRNVRHFIKEVRTKL